MNDQELQLQTSEIFGNDEPTNFEVALYALGILMIPLVPILFVTFFTPFSGLSQ